MPHPPPSQTISDTRPVGRLCQFTSRYTPCAIYGLFIPFSIVFLSVVFPSSLVCYTIAFCSRPSSNPILDFTVSNMHIWPPFISHFVRWSWSENRNFVHSEQRGLMILVCVRHQALTSTNGQNSTTWRQWKENKRQDGWSVLVGTGSLSWWWFSGRSLWNLFMVIQKDGGSRGLGWYL